MIAPGEDASKTRWTSPRCPFLVDYDSTTVDDIRLAVVDAFFSLPRGGAEIGGILLGEYAPGKLTITGRLALECEHAYGPSFTLSPNDHVRLADLIRSTPGGGKDLVGWYHSHTRSEIHLSEADLEIHNRYFSEPWQIAMVIKPSAFKPARVGFFFRESGGAIRTESPYEEFELAPQVAAPAPSSEPPAAPPRDRSSSRRGPHPEPDPEPQEPPAKRHALTLDAVLKDVESPPESLSFSAPPPARRHTRATPAPTEEAPPSRPEAVLAETTAEAPDDSESVAFRGWYWLLVACLVGVLVYQTREYWMGSSKNAAPPAVAVTEQPAPAPQPAPPPTPAPSALSLALTDASGHLQIRWDGASQVVRDASKGSIEITDGERKAIAALDKERLRAGAFTYARESQSVDIRLTVEDANGKRIQETSTFFGKLPEHPAADTEMVKQRDQLAREAARLKAALATQTERANRLEKSLEETRRQLKRDQQRRRLENQVREPLD